MADPRPPDGPPPTSRETSSNTAIPKHGMLARVGKDLVPRVVSAVVLLVVVIGSLWMGSWPFIVLVMAIAAIVAWEWSRIVRGGDVDSAMVAHIAVVMAAVLLAVYGLIGLSMLALTIGAILVNLLCVGRHPGLSALGVPYAGLPAVALLWLRGDEPWGLWAVGFLILAVIATDVGAYFAGRLIGGPKLWPRVSPNKTWAGLIGAMLASAAVSALFATYLGANPWRFAGLGLVLAVIAQAGDFGESMLKRHFGAKDASNIIPGHGGFMDRVDGLIAALVFAALFAASLDVRAPAKALLW